MRTFLNRLWGARRALLIWAVLIGAGLFAGETFMKVAVPEMRPMNEPMIHKMVTVALIVFVIAAAIPFVPGAEIGFGLLLLFGGQAAPVVYVAMVSALMLSFLVARFVPLDVLAQLAGWLGLKKLSDFLASLAAVEPHQRIERLSGQLNGRLAQVALKNRYVLLALLLNTPGNSALGGGGGLAFTAGVSGVFRFWPFLICVLIAVAPFPLFFYLFRS